ncbi:hypothetical protein PAF17_15825 [Paracoccus sp. Z330]|uniref:Uncharacterized protein n=1 Tax=Paracoccus onchidii TaxID=3017813 RepID=A0ABT4ZHX6_9RHOB|nr:hypothetical protein [Paracoccus onchidii]MDB6178960.1 hypothetical protein [Paracoccus onchidii]
MTWKAEAAEIIRQATACLPDDATLSERKKVIADACPSSWRTMSWPQKAWQSARRDYLVRYGYVPRTKAQAIRAASVSEPLPLFDENKPQRT